MTVTISRKGRLRQNVTDAARKVARPLDNVQDRVPAGYVAIPLAHWNELRHALALLDSGEEKG